MLVAGVGPLTGKRSTCNQSADVSILRGPFCPHRGNMCGFKRLNLFASLLYGSITYLNVFLHKNTLMLFVQNILFPEEVHPQLPSPDATMHERPAGKIGMYTRFFDYGQLSFRKNFFAGLAKPNLPLNKDITPALKMDLNAFIRTADPLTLHTYSVSRPSGSVSERLKRGMAKMAWPNAPRKRRYPRSEGTPAASHHLRRLRAVMEGLMVQLHSNLLLLLHLEDGEDHTDSVTSPSLRSVAASAREKDSLLGAKDKEIEELRSQLLKAKEESVAGYNDLLEQERSVLRLQVGSLESTIAKKDRELSDLEISSSSLRSQNQGLISQVFMRFQESFHRTSSRFTGRWLLTHGMKLLMAKCLNSTEYMEALGNAFGRAIEKGMQEGLAARIEHGQAGRCLTNLEAYIPSAKVDFNSVVRDLPGLNFLLLHELSNKKDASTWDVMDLLRLDDVVAEALGMTDLQPDVNQLMVPVHHKQDRVVIGSQALSVALDICRGRVEKMERNLVERLPFLKDVFVSLDHPLSAEALIEPPVVVPATNALSTVVIVPHSGPSVSVEDYENPDLVDVVSENVTLGPEGEENIDASTVGDLAFSKLYYEARDVVL
ncbi:hypothetical protein Tco_1219412 [Tanacetum coccineum]